MNTHAMLCAATLAMIAAPSMAADLSAHIGYNSQYIFRGIPQHTSSFFGGAELGAGGFYLGTWAADVGDGLEVDYYGGYGLERGDFGFSLGATWYTYTDDFDDDYLELNLGARWRWLAFDAAFGEYRNFGGPTLDYGFYSLTASHRGFYGVVGTFAHDFDGSYFEAGYGGTLTIDERPLLDYALAIVHSDGTLLGGNAATHVVLTVSRTLGF
ncbi:MAG: hypothetical protein GTN86_13160 [Xanthomonadales bacterium]|nr:hypothetical protein [Xanthomonadales bacterium]NIN59496.1 hypothetical protein [Xanthomonadales bacterium]NIN74862.1 hypothetical protein [Xanthomonadales bacterium]NIO14946.1 hypothetical protein [Xanthomonadales bacterium]NIP11889.1 hypothetical protein [Xanthomonadales bacterium]